MAHDYHRKTLIGKGKIHFFPRNTASLIEKKKKDTRLDICLCREINPCSYSWLESYAGHGITKEMQA